ncbi:MAG: Inosose isomerase [Firmicutes bacterium ADurb.Bin356]|nr:MAG: Inosose isomerase [Firmicutes bacterium ADurb.Bin356]
MLAALPFRTGAEHLKTLLEAGFDYAELPLAELAALNEADFDAVLNKTVQLGIKVDALNNFFPASLRLTGPDADETAILKYAQKALSLAGRLKVKTIVFGSGPAKNVPPGFPVHKAFIQLVNLLSQLAPIAGGYGITIALEPLRRQECNIINTFEEAVALAHAVNEKNVRVLADYYHIKAENDKFSSIAKLGGEYLTHVHIASSNERRFPNKTDEEDYHGFFSALFKAGYNSRISIEAYSDAFFKDASQSLIFLKTLLNEIYH